MGFVWCSISGRLYGKQAPPELDTPHTITQDSELLSLLKKGKGEQHQQAVDFLTHLAVCNTVVPATTAAGQLIYQVSQQSLLPRFFWHQIDSFIDQTSVFPYTPNCTIQFSDMAVALRGQLCKLCVPCAAAATLL